MVGQAFRALRALFLTGIVLIALAAGARAVPYADLVMDARTGQVLRETNADSRLHPASLTKMMTLYIAFEAIRRGEITLDTEVTISRQAAAEPPSRLGLKAGQKIRLRYLIRAAAVKSANDAATAIGEAIAGSEAAFARRMNRTAQALGMTRSTFKNANGLTEAGHLSTARDMALLGRQLFFDFPEYYNIFSRRSADAGVSQVNNTNRRFLDAYEGADGIKTGYTGAAGFNLVASARRGDERIIASVFGGTSTAQRNARMAELLDLGFSKAPSRVAVNRPATPRYDGAPAEQAGPALVADAGGATGTTSERILRVSGAIARSPRPPSRGGAGAAQPPADLLAAIQTDVAAAVAAANAPAAEEAARASDQVAAAAAAATVAATAELALARVEAAPAAAEEEAEAPAATAVAAAIPAPPPRPDSLTTPEPPVAVATAAAPVAPETQLADAAEEVGSDEEAAEAALLASTEQAVPAAAVAPLPATVAPSPDATVRPVALAMVAPAPASLPDPVLRPEPEAALVVSRLSTSGGRHAGVSIGRYPSRYDAEKALISTALSDTTGFGAALRRIVQRGGGFEANFMGMTAEEADRACRRLTARGQTCALIGG